MEDKGIVTSAERIVISFENKKHPTAGVKIVPFKNKPVMIRYPGVDVADTRCGSTKGSGYDGGLVTLSFRITAFPEGKNHFISKTKKSPLKSSVSSNLSEGSGSFTTSNPTGRSASFLRMFGNLPSDILKKEEVRVII